MTSGMNISIADAVRHLIVCDTQFTWAGVTNLTLEQMMDLQARGWVVEGDDNDEFQLTVAGEEVVARALQSAVQPTLADVQPGGRVRLGDQAERARFEAWPQAREFEIQKDGSGEYLSEVTHGAWLAWKYLSAQPSPGGQWDLKSRFTEWVKANGYNPATFASGRFMGDGVQIAWEAVQALAARQPVYLQGCDELRARTEGERAAYMEGLEEGKKIAARQPVGEPVGHLYRVVVSDAGAAKPWIGRGIVYTAGPAPVEGRSGNGQYLNVYAAPPAPAQAVDLGQFVPAERPLAYLKVATYHEAIGWNECRRSMLALIDSHGARHG